MVSHYFGHHQHWHALLYAAAVTSLFASFLAPDSPLLIQALILWLAAAGVAKWRPYILVLRPFGSREVDGFIKNYLLPSLDRRGRVIWVSEAADAGEDVIELSGVRISIPVAFAVVWCAVTNIFLWSPRPAWTNAIEACVVACASWLLIVSLGNRILPWFITQQVSVWCAFVVGLELRSRGLSPVVVWGLSAVLFMMLAIPVRPFAKVLAKRRLRQSVVRNTTDLKRVETEINALVSIRPRYVANAPVTRVGLFATGATWRPLIQILLAHAQTVAIDVTVVRPNLEWEIRLLDGRSIPRLVTCGRHTWELLEPELKQITFVWSNSALGGDAKQYQALKAYIDNQLSRRTHAEQWTA